VIAIATVLIVVLMTLLASRVATMSLMLTGLSRETARFQARSALTGTGYTTSESETIVNHPLRRRIVLTLMILGSAGIVTVIAAVMISFVNADSRDTAIRLGSLVVALAVFLLLARSDRIDRILMALISRALGRWTELDARDFAALLHLGGGYGVNELSVRDGDWVVAASLSELDLRSEGVAVLGIVCANGAYLGTPVPEMTPQTGDTLILYGPAGVLAELDDRPRGEVGDRAHANAVDEHRERFAAQEELERAARGVVAPGG
jgi:hypothetical protein